MVYLKMIVVLLILIGIVCGATGFAEASLVLPSGLKDIQTEAFLGVTADEIILPDGVKHIDDRAFAGGGQRILLPDSLEYIAPNAFDGAENLTAIVNPGSYAHIWCIENGVSHKMQMAVGKRLDMKFEYGGTGFNASESSNPLMAVVDSSGRVTGLSKGNVSIKMSGDDGSTVEVALEIIDYADANRALCVAHRGASGYYRENTIEAFEYAQTLGADIVELDVHKTKDGVIVVFHDKKIKSGNTKKAVSSLTYKNLLKLDSRICTLEEAIECIEKTDMMVMVEFKAAGITETVINIVEEGGMGARALYSGFDLDTLLEVEQLRPDVDTAYSINSLSLLKKIIAAPEDYNIDIAGVNYEYLTEARVRDLHLSGKGVYAWTVNTKSSIAKCVAMGVDGILTNYPDYM